MRVVVDLAIGDQEASSRQRDGGPMARRTFDVVDVMEILAHWRAGRSKGQIAESLGLDRKTVRKYLAPAEAEGLAPGGPPVGAAEWRERAAGWFPELADARLRQVTWPEIEKYHEFIAAQLGAGVTVKGAGDGEDDPPAAV